MTLILDTEKTERHEHLVNEAARTAPETELETPAKRIFPILFSQKKLAVEALKTFALIDQKQAVTETAALLPHLISSDKVHDARGYLEDWGWLWRRQTDIISGAIAVKLPDQQLGNLVMSSVNFFTDNRRLYGEDNGVVMVYDSLKSPDDLKSDIQYASPDQWQDFLFRITLM